jgi:adenosylmethionine-8-amino-7-oxononanoate aminotransferase
MQDFPTSDLIAWDREFLWHPFTPMKPWCENKDILVIARGEREFLIDTEGRRYIDGVSSLWCNVHGHCVPELDAALRDQLSKIAHSTLLGLANIPSILLAKRLVELTRSSRIPLDKVFYSDNGSTAVEVACKMAFQFWQNQNAPRSRFIAFTHSYHGDTLGAISLGGIPLFHQTFKPLCFPTDFVSAPQPSDSGHASLTAIDNLLSKNPHSHVAIIIEPLVMGAGGMHIYPSIVLRKLRDLANRHNTLLIFDEVLTAFGRTGTMFATEHSAIQSDPSIENQKSKIENPITPDLLCLSKGLTAGYMPLGVTMTTQKIFDAFYADPAENKTFYHGHTFTGHPLACAVALASLDLFEKNQLLDHVQNLFPILAGTLQSASRSPFVKETRQCGLIGAIDLAQESGEPFPARCRIASELCTRLRTREILLRPLADTLVIMPPLAITRHNMQKLCDGVLQGISWLPEISQQNR